LGNAVDLRKKFCFPDNEHNNNNNKKKINSNHKTHNHRIRPVV